MNLKFFQSEILGNNPEVFNFLTISLGILRLGGHYCDVGNRVTKIK